MCFEDDTRELDWWSLDFVQWNKNSHTYTQRITRLTEARVGAGEAGLFRYCTRRYIASSRDGLPTYWQRNSYTSYILLVSRSCETFRSPLKYLLLSHMRTHVGKHSWKFIFYSYATRTFTVFFITSDFPQNSFISLYYLFVLIRFS
jgi:DNA-directed RNA polymerase subunit N (RpoN/RPB10)